LYAWLDSNLNVITDLLPFVESVKVSNIPITPNPSKSAAGSAALNLNLPEPGSADVVDVEYSIRNP
jgi:hypothetical protein